MNIISARRAYRAARDKARALERRRSRVKDKTGWDVKNATKLVVARKQMQKLSALLVAALREQGQFGDDPPVDDLAAEVQHADE